MSCQFDVIVIGSGIGGLTAALAAAQKGQSVLVLEAGKQFGGYLNPFQRGKFHFDPGLHYIGECGPEGRFTQLLEALGLEELEFNEVGLETGFDQYSFPGFSVTNTKGLDVFRDRVIEQFPAEKRGIQKFFRFIKKADVAMSVAMKLRGPLSFLKAARHLPFLLRWKDATLKDMLDAHFKDPNLKAVMAGPCGDIGLGPAKMHGFIHLGILLHYAGGAYFPVGGTARMRDVYITHLKSHGAVLKRFTTVDRIFTQQGRVTGIKTRNGEFYYGQSVISNIQADLTYKMLDNSLLPEALVEKCKNLEMSPGSVCVFLGVKNSCDLSQIGDKNIWHYSTVDIDGLYNEIFEGALPDGRSFFLSCPSNKDPGGDHAPEGYSVVEIVTLANQKPFQEWAGKPTMKRGQDYKDLKEQLADTLIEAAEQYIPGLKEAVVVKEVSTPNTNYAFVKAPEGNIYGPAQVVSQSGQSRFTVNTPVKGLFLCGASVMSAGILPCAASGFWAGKAAHRYLNTLRVKLPPFPDPSTRGRSFVSKLARHAAEKPDVAALWYKKDGAWVSISWEEYERQMRLVAGGLLALGLEPGNCVSIACGNRYEWVVAQMGIMAGGGVMSSLFLTSTAEQNAYILQHCQARFIFVEDREQYDKVMAQRANLPHLKKMILIEEIKDADPQFTMSWEALLQLGSETQPEHINAIMDALKPDDLAFLIYTSGTTGHPKAVMINHRNLDVMSKSLVRRFPISRYRVISFLPLSHIAEQSITNITHLEKGGEVFFCREMEKLKEYLVEVQPTILFAVPRVWEKVEAALKAKFAEMTGPGGRLLSKALKIEASAFQKELKTGARVGGSARVLANKLVIKGVRKKLGLNNLEVALSGAAPTSAETQHFFASIGVRLIEVYGMSETTGILTSTPPNHPKPGSIGVPVEGVEIKLAEDGEILCRGPATTSGYFNDPEQTAQLWRNGWLHTGDLGGYDDDGYLMITGRKKDLIITSGGKKVSPAPVEDMLNRLPWISQSMLVGEARPYLAAFIALNLKGAAHLADQAGLVYEAPQDLARNQKFRDLAQKEVDLWVNKHLARHETVKRLLLLAEPFRIENDEVTPTLKVKRNVVLQRYAQEIEALFP